MATASDTNMCIAFTLAGTAIVFSAHHTYKFDKWQCLLPKRKEWFRVLLTWMLIVSTVAIFVWAVGWAAIRYHLGWVTIPDIGAIPYPSNMFEQKYTNLNMPLMIVFNIAFSIQASLNAEEGLYWYHLMRAVRQPKTARAWQRSSFFYAWIIISIICTALQSGVGWIFKRQLDLNDQMARTMTVHGCIEFAVMLAASIVIWKFPAFLRDVKASGAGPDVRSRLHFYHEANKIRTFFRALFSACMIIMGVDGMTEAKRVNMSHMANGQLSPLSWRFTRPKQPITAPPGRDLISQITFGSYFFVLVTSYVLYLPRSWTPDSEQRVMVAGGRGNRGVSAGVADVPDGQLVGGAQLASGVALMSLLREGGQWDGDDDLRAIKSYGPGHSHGNGTPVMRPGMGMEQYNLASPDMWKSESEVQLHKKESDIDSERESHLGPPLALENFTSPLAVPLFESPRPAEIRIHIAQEVHQDRGDHSV
ncbi:hypothetical protein IAU59_003428 [Kwoniella sp. CBS 9459]